jgi:hypothetical protein
MQLAIETLLDGVMRTLREAVLPSVEGRFARGQLFAVLDVLQNLRDRVEPRADLDDAEAASAETALRAVIATLGRDAAAPLVAALAGAPAAPPGARAAALRAALVRALAVLDDLPEATTAPARAALAQHLAAQAMRDVATLKPSLLEEISKG